MSVNTQFLIFDSSVCLGMPSLVAAPVGPEISPAASRSAFSIISLSRSTRFATSGTLVAAAFEVTGVSVASPQRGEMFIAWRFSLYPKLRRSAIAFACLGEGSAGAFRC